MSAERTIVTFRCPTFNVNESKDYFINSENFGDDLAKWLSEQLQKHAIQTQKDGEFPGQEDFGWFFNCKLDQETFCIVIGHHYDDKDFEWVVWIERKCGLFKSLLGGRKKNIDSRIPQAIHDVLFGSDTISHIRWHRQEDFHQGRLTEASTSPV
jgi:hypothetical protein